MDITQMKQTLETTTAIISSGHPTTMTDPDTQPTHYTPMSLYAMAEECDQIELELTHRRADADEEHIAYIYHHLAQQFSDLADRLRLAADVLNGDPEQAALALDKLEDDQ